MVILKGHRVPVTTLCSLDLFWKWLIDGQYVNDVIPPLSQFGPVQVKATFRLLTCKAAEDLPSLHLTVGELYTHMFIVANITWQVAFTFLLCRSSEVNMLCS